MVTRVIKLGGSLLELSDWAERVRQWLRTQGAATNAIVVGGGDRVEALRERQLTEKFDDEQAHVLALELMDCNAAEVARVLAEAHWAPDWHPGEALPTGRLAILECGGWAAGDSAFERNWRTTSDSVAAEIASRLGAAELVLLKSCLPVERISEVVDPRFEEHLRAGQLVRVINLRAAAFPEFVWEKGLQSSESSRR